MALEIREIMPSERRVFADIWIPWLQDTMGLAPQAEDLAAMDDPARYYGETGGSAFLALVDGTHAGAVAVKGLGADGFEFCKLVVADAARGQGAGGALIGACLDYAARKGGPDLWLQSFRKLDVALGMYERMGFVHAPPPAGMTVLDRTEIIMKKRVV